MNVLDNNGIALDATFFIDASPLALVYESAGGRSDVNPRNRDYSRGLALVLQRLAALGITIQKIEVDSVITRRLRPEERLVKLRRYRMPLPLALVADVADLRRDISTAAREPGARVGSAEGGSSRRLRFFMRVAPLAPPTVEGLIARGALSQNSRRGRSGQYKRLESAHSTKPRNR